MIKKIIKLLTFFIVILVIVILYLSYFGIETKRFNKIIKDSISKNNKELDIEFKKVKILLNLTSLTVGINTKNPKILQGRGVARFSPRRLKFFERRTYRKNGNGKYIKLFYFIKI